MSEELENSVREMLKEETWTRVGISGFTKNNLTELSQILERTYNENQEDMIKEICDKQLENTKNSIVALYLSGMIALKSRSLDNSCLITLVDIFEKNHKEQLIEQLCNSILEEEPQNLFALRKLAEYYKNNNDDKVWELYEKIVKNDSEEADIAKILAERYESQQNENAAVNFYKKAIGRFINAKNFAAVKEIWSKLITLNSDNLARENDFFFSTQKKIAKTISEDKSVVLMQELYQHYRNSSDWTTAIKILKLILEIDSKDAWARKELVECYREKYADRSHLEDYIKSSNLSQSFRNVFEAISDFEKHIAFDAGNFVYHRTWGVGKIESVQGDTLKINFGKKTGKKDISLKMAVTALQPLPKNHIWVIKATHTKADLNQRVKADVAGTLKTIIKSFDNACDEKKIKQELVPAILTPGEWTSWHSKAQNILESDNTFAVTPTNINQYMVRDHELTPEERLGNEFKAEKQFYPRIDILFRYVENDDIDSDNEIFAEMFNYFANFLKSINSNDDEFDKVVGSYLITRYISEQPRFKDYTCPAKFTFAEFYEEISEAKKRRDIYVKLKNKQLKELYLRYIKENVSEWQEEYVHLFPIALKKEILDTLLKNGKQDMLKKLVKKSFDEYKNNRDAVIYFFANNREDDWYKEADIPYEKQLVTLINIISVCFREVKNHVNTTDNKKTIKQANALLFEEKTDKGPKNNVLDYIMDKDVETISRMFTLVNDNLGEKDTSAIEPKYRDKLKAEILGKYPDFKFQEAEIKQEVQKGLMVTAKMLDVKKAHAEKLEKEILPQIAREVSEAREKGDLSENAEYDEAKKAQRLANDELNRLKNDLSQAITFDPATVDTHAVSFGTTVTFRDNIANKDVTYTILGPWESDPNQGIISYLSPLGEHLLDATVGENRTFSINTNSYNLTVTSIVPAKL
ncbi:MAG: transcription elongation factor GreA [Treponema sp.]|nr:transcription elongation factor GreA [Treponema sp.]